jgi:hypothetical protein
MKLRELSLPAPTSSKEFETLCLAVYQRIWRDHNAKLNGVIFQDQHGVDIFGVDSISGDLYGVQCKVRAGARGKLSFSAIEEEVEKAERFEPELQHFIIATTAPRNAMLQEKVRLLSRGRIKDGLFAVHLAAWDDLILMLDQYPEVATHFYPSFKSKVVEDKNICDVCLPEQLTVNYAGVLSRRLNYAMTLLNEGKQYNAISMSRMAEMLGAERISDVSKYFDGKEEPTIGFLREFAIRFGVNAEWLIHGENDAFYCAEPIAFDPLDALPFLEAWKPEEIFIVRSKSECGECLLIAKLGDWKYVTINGIWHVSSCVGGTGRSQLVNLYDLFMQMLERHLPCSGFIVEEATFYKIQNGEIYPGSVLERHNGNAGWWIALLNVDHNKDRARLYRGFYGQTFLDAQRILRECLSPDMRKNEWNGRSA